MNAFLIVCPHCQARYQVPNAAANGKAVACKKCGQKFAAKVMRATPKGAPAAATPTPQAPPATDDPFADLFTSEGAATSDPLGASPLAAMPRKKAKSKPFPWALVAIGGGAVAMLAVLAISIVAFLGSSDPASEARRLAEADYAAHAKIADQHMKIMTDFVSAAEGVKSDADLPAFIQKTNSLSERTRQLAKQVSGMYRLTEEQNERLSKQVKSRLKSFESRAKDAGNNLAKYRSAELASALIDFQAASGDLGLAISTAKRREIPQPGAASQPAPTNVASNSTSPPPAAKPTGTGSITGDVEKQRAIQTEYLSIIEASVDLQIKVTGNGDLDYYIEEQNKLTERFKTLNNRLRVTYRLRPELQNALDKELQARSDAVWARHENAKLNDKMNGAKFQYDKVHKARGAFSSERVFYMSTIYDYEYRPNGDTSEGPLGDTQIASQPPVEKVASTPSQKSEPVASAKPEPFRPFANDDEGNEADDSPANDSRTRAEEQREAFMGATSGQSQPPRGMPMPGPRPGFGPPGANMFRDRVGADNMVTFEAPAFPKESIDAVRSRLEDKLDSKGYSSRSGGGMKYAVLELPYSGDIEELAQAIDFGEVEEVSVAERRIRLKSLSFSE
ncbi:zinc-ribbon domain-containing protein [Blastopirellula marina]|uniref:Zinc finger/thioredoxin putative domain-containing protein n=1 Tax=Blastopirellula marina TaxID=124 RepID=A0A2S8GN20_9BACT|nr:zinc-ribbon domain-containing protein [Blastopirellula marina]PQO45836.1 hypothetical protein C5Y93_11300 [Blastopirellula marina]